MRPLFALFLLCCSFAFAGESAQPGHVVEHFAKTIVFHEDGSWQAVQSATVRVTSQEAVKRFETLSFRYEVDTQKAVVDFVRVRKPSGAVVETAASEAQDVADAVDPNAPVYGAAVAKRIAVRGLVAGDVLEYQVHFEQPVAEIPRQFWYSHEFLKKQTVLDERLTIRVPADKFVRMESASAQPQIAVEGGEKVYRWTRTEALGGRVELSTFRSWAELGAWYAGALRRGVQVTPKIKEKADEVTRPYPFTEDKRRALYEYVSTQFRYVAMAFGPGKYVPHSAEQVLANGYGDCKDKHTLLAALLKAEGMTAAPALVGLRTSEESDIPSPERFDHVVTVVVDGGKQTWLDTTPGLAPYGLLIPELRGADALLLEEGWAAQWVTIPAAAPFAMRQEVNAEGALLADGTVEARVNVVVRGDDELTIRNAFRLAAREQWLSLVQGLASNMGLDGSVSGVEADEPTSTREAFHFGFDYRRKNEHPGEQFVVTPPMFPFVFALDETDHRPNGAVRIAAEGEMTHRWVLHLPAGVTANIPERRDVRTPFASFGVRASQIRQTLTIEQKITVERGIIQAAEWDAYLAFLGQVKQREFEAAELRDVAPQPARVVLASTAVADSAADLKVALAAQKRAVALQPDSITAKLALVELLLRDDEKLQALQLLDQVTRTTESAAVWNNAAYLLAEANQEPKRAVQYAQRAVDLLEQDMAHTKLASFTDRDLRNVEALASAWDTLGWAFFKAGDPSAARRYLQAAWDLGQTRTAAEHLRQVVTSNSVDSARPDALERRTLAVPDWTGAGSAEYFLLFANDNVIDAQYISGTEWLKDIGPRLVNHFFPAVLPETGPERIVRRAVLDFSTGQCRITLLPPAEVALTVSR